MNKNETVRKWKKPALTTIIKLAEGLSVPPSRYYLFLINSIPNPVLKFYRNSDSNQ